ncbi:MFS transporter [Ralstonia solanacearum]|uniref:MFS transporter n=1 Tax=Ralstonia solanacearum TaxID=305 RepID=UPI0018D0BA37|nr:MFS transporter [Ralstonia solanacearum]
MNVDIASARPPVLAGFGLGALLTLAMALPMLILYAIGTLGPFLIDDLRIAPGWLGYATMSTFSLAAVLSPVAGPMVERLDPRRGLHLLFLAVALAYTLIVVVPGFGGVVAAVAVGGIAQALSNPVTNLLIAQRVAPQNKALVVGLKQSGVQVGALFAGLCLPVMTTRFGWRAAVGGMVPVALALGLMARFMVPPQPLGRARRIIWSRPNPLLRRLMGVQACVGIALSAFVTFLPVFAVRQGASTAQAGLMIALFGAMGIVSRLLLTPLGGRLKDESHLLLALLGVSALAVGVTMQADAASRWMLWVGAAGMGLSAVATNAIAMGMLLRDPAFGTAATASGWLSAAFFGGFAFGPPVCGAIAGSGCGFAGAWCFGIVVLMVGCVPACALIRARRPAR